MKISMIRGNDKKAEKKIAEILALYNADKGLGATFTNDYPEKSIIVSVKGKAGGIIVETIYKGGAFIYYAAFAGEDRRKGYLRRCIDEYNTLTPNGIVGVQIDIFDNFEVWANMGFKESNQVIFNGAITRLNITPEQLNINMKKYPNNDNF